MNENDHRNLGKSLDLYHIAEDAPGMVFWHQRGYAIYRVLEDYIRQQMRSLGFQEVRTPQLLPRDMWVKSGHWDKFSENMFCLADDDGKEFALKPMSCPCHIEIFNQGIRSWRDLPVRYSEFGACHRNEPSGSMHGLMRTRAFEQDDAHVLCRESDVQNEVSRFIGLLNKVYADLGFDSYHISLSTRPAVRSGSDELWDWAEAQLIEAARCRGVKVKIQEGEGAFYGPKLEFILKDSQGRSWQCGTVQLDTVLPHRLNASYINENGQQSVPIMIHHAVFGSIGRIIAILLEHYNGNLPAWLAPDQIAIVPISREQNAYAYDVHQQMLDSGIRSIMYDMNGTLSRKLVQVHDQKIPFSIIIGRREADAGMVTIRPANGDQSSMKLAEAIPYIRNICQKRNPL